MATILGLVIGLVFFIATITAYSIGVKHGRIVKDGGVPNMNPIKAIETRQQIKTEKEKADLFSEGLANLLSFGEHIETKERR